MAGAEPPELPLALLASLVADGDGSVSRAAASGFAAAARTGPAPRLAALRAGAAALAASRRGAPVGRAAPGPGALALLPLLAAVLSAPPAAAGGFGDDDPAALEAVREACLGARTPHAAASRPRPAHASPRLPLTPRPARPPAAAQPS